MLIHDQLKVKDIQDKFHDIYPGLMLKIFRVKHAHHKGSSGDAVGENVILKDIYPQIKAGKIDLDQEKTVLEVEQEFEQRFGLSVQIYRRSADLWLQTIGTDEWSLETQNRKGLHSQERKVKNEQDGYTI